jgi:hypothetical protein
VWVGKHCGRDADVGMAAMYKRCKWHVGGLDYSSSKEHDMQDLLVEP